MGLAAYVSCTCWAEGKALPFERPELVQDEGGPNLAVDDEGNRELYQRFLDWKRTACPHPGMHLVYQRISNLSDYRTFQEALARLGWQRFPTLQAELPEGNSGAMDASSAALMLDELQAFAEAVVGQDEVVLVDSDTGALAYSYVAGYQGLFLWAGSIGYEVGFDPAGLFVRRPPRLGSVELFRAMRVDRPPGRFVDRDTGVTLECPLDWGEGRRFEVTVRAMTAGGFDHIIEPLRIVCRASVATGNLVFWA
ncbi:MAG: hypothetical protein IT370_18365 [Deltaproteobacteria bacterium]|nr:hypothetical protein [Deltaproteobacteria bacterium]